MLLILNYADLVVKITYVLITGTKQQRNRIISHFPVKLLSHQILFVI